MIKHAMITGGSSGIGKAVAQLLASRGANISIIARDRDKLEKARQEIVNLALNSSQKILTFVADVAQPLKITVAIEKAISEQGTPDILITSAGIAIPGYFQDLTLETFEQTMRVNYFGSLYAVKAVLPAMAAAQKGNIVLISSGAGLIGLYGYTAYSSSKFALRGFAESLRGELKPKGIKVSIVYPPDTDTPQLIAENQTKPPETKAITATAKTWSAEGVAQEIVKGINQQKFAISPGFEMTVLNRFHSLIAPLLNKYFDRLSSRS
jgi:3-dehydrosphinganine reductase